MTIDTTTSAFLKEVDEHLHYERMTALWKKYRIPFFVAVAGVFVVAGGVKYAQQNREAALHSQARTYWESVAVAEGEAIKTAPLATLQGEAAPGYRLLSAFELARVALGDGKTKEAAAHFATIAEDGDIPTVYRDLATFYQAQTLMGTDDAAAQTLLTRLESGESAFAASAQEMLGYMAEKNEKWAEAIGYFEQVLQRQIIPQTQRQRVETRLKAVRRITGSLK